jgi:membrane fusion protein (multidrug efflux system)
MKKMTLFFAFAAVIASCGGKKSNLEQLKADLADKRKQVSTLNDEIKGLEEKIAKLDTSASKGAKSKLIQITEIKNSSFTNYIDVMGKVDADKNANLSAKVPGMVTKVFVTPGSQVREGQILAEIDNSAMSAGIEELKSQMRFANDLFDKQKALWDQKIGSEVQFLSAKNNKDALEKKLATLNEQLDMYRIKAPFNGVVDDVFIKVGQVAAPGIPAIRLVNFSGLKVVANVAETYLSMVKAGNQVRIEFPDLNASTQTTLHYVAGVVDPMTRCIKVEAGVNNIAGIKPNMIAVMKISDYSNAKTIVVPVNTVQSNDEGTFVLVAASENGKMIARRRAVVTGPTYNGQTEIKSGLSVGDKLITNGFQDLNDGDDIAF